MEPFILGGSQIMTQYDRGGVRSPEEAKIVWRNKWTACKIDQSYTYVRMMLELYLGHDSFDQGLATSYSGYKYDQLYRNNQWSVQIFPRKYECWEMWKLICVTEQIFVFCHSNNTQGFIINFVCFWLPHSWLLHHHHLLPQVPPRSEPAQALLIFQHWMRNYVFIFSVVDYRLPYRVNTCVPF